MSVEKSYRQGPEWTDPHPYDMPPAERAAWANGRGTGRREVDAEISSLRAELAGQKAEQKYLMGLAAADAEALRAELAAEREKAHYANGVADLALKHRNAAESAIVVYVAAARQDAEEKARLRHPWRNVGEKDWEQLFERLGHRGPDYFWRLVFNEVRAALACRPQREIEVAEFKPCVVFNEELRLTEMLLEDRFTAATGGSSALRFGTMFRSRPQGDDKQ